MAENDSDDTFFMEEMAREGVVPLDRGRTDKVSGQDRPRRAKAKGRGRESGPARDSKATGARARQPGVESGASDARAKELARVREELTASRAACERLERERDAWARERKDLEQRFERERAEEKERVQRERKGFERREQKLRDELARAQAMLDSQCSLAEALRARGCADDGEAITVLQKLLDVRPRDVLASLDRIAPQTLARLLEERVAFVAEGVDAIESGPDCVVIRVPAHRCEITGGSDIRAAFYRLRQACQRASARQLTIVGGSPAYRRQLAQLTERHGDGLVLNLVSGTKRRARKRAEADMRSSDLVIIWGATELDHSVSAVYTRAPDKTVYAAHRGISRMLLYVADALDSRTCH